MNSIDKNMLFLIDSLKLLNIIKYDTEFCDAIGLLKQNLINIRNGKAHFTPEHIRLACKKYDVDANWVFGQSTWIYRSHPFDPRLKEKKEELIKK